MPSPAPAHDSKLWGTFVPRRRRYYFLFMVLLTGSVLFITFVSSARSGRIFDELGLGLFDALWAHDSVNDSFIVYPPDSPRYLLFEPPKQEEAPTVKFDKIYDTRLLASECLDAHIAKGAACNAGLDARLDVIWTWVNGSDRLLMESMSRTARQTQPKQAVSGQPNTRLYRDHDELLHSVRSVLQYFRGSMSRLRILTSDFPFTLPIKDENGTQINKQKRLGLAPTWLRMENAPTWWDGNVELEFTYHAQIFTKYQTGIFNSFAIESQLVNMNLSDQFIYMNDDFFMLAELTASDFYTSEYGVVLRLQPELLVPSSRHPTTSDEWGPLEFTNWCISNRFGTRRRPYMIHAAKALSLPLLKEFTNIWHAETLSTSTRPFRGSKQPHQDLYTIFLFTHTVVERWREALLWSWAVGRNGGNRDQWGVQEKQKAWDELARGGGQESNGKEIKVRITKRVTSQEIRVKSRLLESGHLPSGKTQYTFVSGDGYPYGFVDRKKNGIWPKFNSDGDDVICTIQYQECFGNASITTASEFFKWIAFEKAVECGDCFIHALRSASGESGLSAFLPDASREFTPDASSDSQALPGPPHLPTVSDWRTGDFSLRAVLPAETSTNVRRWALRLLERYRFVLGDTPTRFELVLNPGTATALTKKLDKDTKSALLCMNDNIKANVERADKILYDWQEKRWPHRASWEKN